MIFLPERPGSWNYGAREAQKAFVKVAEAIGESEKVYMLVSKAQMENAKNQLGHVSGVTLLECETDDALRRDVEQPWFWMRKGRSVELTGSLMPGEVPLTGFTGTGEKDDRVAAFICRTLGCPCLGCQTFCAGGRFHPF